MSKTTIDVLEEIESTSGKLAKVQLIDDNSKNELLKRVFVAAQDPYTVFYVNKFKVPVASAPAPQQDDAVLERFIDGLAPLAARDITGNAAKEYVTSMFAAMDARQQKWCQRILLKNLRVGCQESSLNKVWPGIVKSFAVALAEQIKSSFVKGEGIKILEPVNYPVRVEPKLDGLRCIAVKQAGIVTFYTRNGTVLETLPKIKAALEAGIYDNMVLDGEAMGKDWNESASVLMARKTHKDDSNIVYNVFDAMSLAEWVEQSCQRPYNERVEVVTSIVAGLPGGSPVKQVQHIMAENEQQLMSFFQKCMDENFEGVMLKTLDSPYKFKRSSYILKLKPIMTVEGVIVGTYDGRRGTKNEGKWGGFEVVLPNGIITRCGGGFNDDFRADVALNGQDAFLGRIVEMEAQPEPGSKDGLTGDGKARFPVFVRFRSEADVDPAVLTAGINHFNKDV